MSAHVTLAILNQQGDVIFTSKDHNAKRITGLNFKEGRFIGVGDKFAINDIEYRIANLGFFPFGAVNEIVCLCVAIDTSIVEETN